MRTRSLILMAGAMALLGLAACDDEPEVPAEAGVRAVFGDCVRAANMRDLKGFESHFAEELTAPQGTKVRRIDEITQVLRNPELAMVFNPKLAVVPVDKKHATADVTLVLSRQRARRVEDLPPSAIAKVLKIAAKLEYRKGQWLITGFEYKVSDTYE